MSTYILRIFVYVVLPLLLGALHVWLDRGARTRERRLELFLLYLMGIGVGANGIGGFSGHLFASDQVAEAIGWPAGNPFQLEVGFANLAIGILGVVAIGRRDGFREATVIAVTVFSVGATVVHIMDIAETGNLAPGNTVQNVGNLLRPALLIALLAASRRAARGGESELQTAEFERWRAPNVNIVATITGGVAMGFGIGLALGQGLLGALLGVSGGAAIGVGAAARSARAKR
jgi:uncharacterized membrane-anchored protein YitT (DUF2179 family)